jgi:hypothetical protein
MIMFRIARSFTERPKGSNFIEQELSVVNFMNKQKILNNVKSNKDIVKVKGSWENHVTYGVDREDMTITYNDQ